VPLDPLAAGHVQLVHVVGQEHAEAIVVPVADQDQ
jgi:hypothetical protein